MLWNSARKCRPGLFVVIQMRDDHPVGDRQATGPAALATRLIECVRWQYLRNALAQIAIVGGVFLAQALACDGIGQNQLSVCAEQQQPLHHLVAEGAQDIRGRQ